MPMNQHGPPEVPTTDVYFVIVDIANSSSCLQPVHTRGTLGFTQ
jgi:hypothetical protein